MDPIAMAVGFGIFMWGWLMGRWDRRNRKPKLKDPSICGCGHHESFHDENGCGHTRYSYDLNKVVGCTCKRFASVDPARYLSYKELGG